MSLVGLVIIVLVVALLYWALDRILKAFNVQDPINTVVRVLFVVIVAVMLLEYASTPHQFRLLP
jgi:uncharacterized membrane protein YwzB